MTGDMAYALAALVCYGIGDLIYKRAAAAGLAANHFLMGQAWFFCPAVIAYALLTGTLAPGTPALWGALAGLVILAGFYCYAESLSGGSVSVIAPIFRLNFIVTAALAIGLLGEPLTLRKLVAFGLALAAGWLLLGTPRGGGDRPQMTRRALVEVLVATLATGAANFCHKLGLVAGAAPETLLAAQAVVFTALITALTWRMTGRVAPPAGFARHSGPAALVLLAAFLFLLHGMRHGEASVVVPVAQMGFVPAAVLGIVLFGEGWSARKLAGLAAATAALLLLAAG